MFDTTTKADTKKGQLTIKQFMYIADNYLLSTRLFDVPLRYSKTKDMGFEEIVLSSKMQDNTI